MNPPARRALGVTADLEVVASGGEVLQVRGDGARLRVEAAGLGSSWRAARSVGALTSEAQWRANGIELLPLTGLGLDLSVRGHVIASVEP